MLIKTIRKRITAINEKQSRHVEKLFCHCIFDVMCWFRLLDLIKDSVLTIV